MKISVKLSVPVEVACPYHMCILAFCDDVPVIVQVVSQDGFHSGVSTVVVYVE